MAMNQATVSSCLCYYSYIEDLGLHAVYITHYVIRITKHLRNRIEIIEIERQYSKSNHIARNMNILFFYTRKKNELKLKLMIAMTKSPTKDKIDKYILALIIVQYIEDITWLRGDTKFPSEWC